MNPIPFTGQVIHEPGIYADVPIETYHGNPYLLDGFSISSSGMREFIERPSLYWGYSVYNRNRFERAEKPHFSFGQAAHMLLLEGAEGFDARFAVRPEKAPDGRQWHASNKSCKEWLEAQEGAGKAVLTQSDLDAIRFIRDSLQKHPFVRNGLLDGMTEMSVFARFGNIWFRSRPDVLPAVSNGDMADLKTAASVSERSIETSLRDNRYYVQAAMARMVMQKLYEDWQFGGFALVWAEKSAPYDVAVTELDPGLIDLGEQLVRAALPYLSKCIERMEWPGRDGFSAHMPTVSIPPYAKTNIELEIQAMKQEIAA